MRRIAGKKSILEQEHDVFTLVIYHRCPSATCEPSLKRSRCLDPKEIKINKSNMSGISSFLYQAKSFFFFLIWLEFASKAGFPSEACFDEYVIYYWNRKGLWKSSDGAEREKQRWIQEEERQSWQLSCEMNQKSQGTELQEICSLWQQVQGGAPTHWCQLEAKVPHKAAAMCR